MSILLRLPIPIGKYPDPMVKKEIDPVRAGFGMRLKAARTSTEEKFTQAQVAARFGVDVATVSAWETGRGDPGVFRLRELSKLYKTSSESLVWENAPSNEAMQIAAAFDGLDPRRQQTFHALWLAFLADALSDAGVEASMDVIRERAQRLRDAGGPLVHPVKSGHLTDEDQKKEN